MFQTNLYLPISEIETSNGYVDMYLQRRSNLYPGIKNDWVWELKYIKTKEADNEKETLIEEKKKEAIAQLQRYKNSNIFKDRMDVRYLAIVFVGKKECFVFSC